MADIGNEIDAIRAAKVGEEVRGTIADALEAMNAQAAAAQEWATGEDDPTDEPGPENNAAYYAAQAAASATDAAASATTGPKAIANEAPEYSTSGKYSAGDYVVYNNDLYRCTTEITSGEAWTASHWTAVKLGSELTGVTNALTEYIESAAVTESIDRTASGLTLAASSGQLVMYGTATANRDYCFVNGQDVMKATTSDFSKTLEAGTYLIKTDMSGYQTAYSFEATYSTFAVGNYFRIANTTTKTAVVTFTAPVMIGLVIISGRNYGTSDNPSYVSFSAKRMAAKDIVARSEITDLADDVGALNGEVDEIQETLTDILNWKEEYDFTGETQRLWSISQSGTWLEWGEDTLTRSYVIACSDAESVSIAADAENGSYIAFLQSFEPVDYGNVDFSASYPSRIFISAGITNEYDIPADALYLYVLKTTSNGVEMTPTVTFTYKAKRNPYSIYPTGDTTDRTAEVEKLLHRFGICRFEKGRYYLKNVNMPDNTTVEGCGASSQIVLLEGTGRTAAFRLGSRCCVKNLMLYGALSTISKNTDGMRNGVLYEGIGRETTIYRGIISNCYFYNFTGGCICLNNTGMRVYSGLNIDNCYMYGSYAGIDIPYMSEFNRVNNCSISECHYGILNNGGNNEFTGCNLSANDYGFAIDNSSGTKTNNAHGGMTGCIIQHCHTRAVYINKTASGFVITGCNIDDGGIEIINSARIIISACNFMYNSPMILSGTYSGMSMIMFIGCNLRKVEANTYTIENGCMVKFVNCYAEDGCAVDPTMDTAGTYSRQRSIDQNGAITDLWEPIT